MNIFFITRCYKPTNLQAIKDNLKDVFNGQDKHTYVHYLLVDMSYGEKLLVFYKFEDEHTKVVLVYNKADYYNCEGIDSLINRLSNDLNNWVYILDDDNLINKNFLKAFDDYEDEDVVIVNCNMIKIREPLVVGKIVGKSDISNIIIKLKVKQEVPIYIEGHKSYSSDGVFLLNLVKRGYKFKYRTDLLVVTYRALSRPLNVLRRDL